MTRVLFIHGLESGPNGRKPVSLREQGYDVESELMPCGRSRALRDPAVLAGAGLTLAAISWATARRGLRGLAGGVSLAAALGPLAKAAITRRAFSRSVAVQRRALARSPIDVVMGSSFGGAVALRLLQSGAWSGPTVLLCPAHELVADRARGPVPAPLSALPPSVAERVLVVHARQDAVVPIEHSRRLVAGSRARLIEVDDDHPLTATSTGAQLGAWIDEALGRSPIA